MRKVQKWFERHIKDGDRPYTLDKYQAAVILDAHKNTLVTARAGSGKTRTSVAKIIYLIAHEHIRPEEIIAFAFNRKAKTEINERLSGITCDGQPIFREKVQIATTFHAFSYQILGGKEVIGDHIITEDHQNRLIVKICEKTKTSPENTLQFITRAEQLFFADYAVLHQRILAVENAVDRETLLRLETALKIYRSYLKKHRLYNFNQIIAESFQKIPAKTPYRYIFVDEYQDFSLLFLELIRALRKTCPAAHLLAVGDDWQAINRFAGSDVKYFQHFEKYFPEDCQKLFLPTNYRSGKRIVENANFFMGEAVRDFQGCKSGNKTKAKIYAVPVNAASIPLGETNQDLPLLLQKYQRTVAEIIAANPGKSIKILHRNNDLSFRGWTLEKFCENFPENVSFSTIHKSKGLESDVVILLEIDAEKFPGRSKNGDLFAIFGDTAKTLFEDESRLFYVALTRPREKLYILSKTTRVNKPTARLNFFSYLNDSFLSPLF